MFKGGSYESKNTHGCYDADEVIVLLSSFDVAIFGADKSLNAGDTYDDWNWILVRKDGGQWEHVDHGY